MADLKAMAKEARNAYKREYYRKNKDKVKAWQDAYWMRRYDEMIRNNAARAQEK